MSSVPSPAGYSTTRADKEFEGLSTDIEHQHNDHPSSWYNVQTDLLSGSDLQHDLHA